MKLLFISQGYSVEDQIGWDWSWRQLEKEGVLSLYTNLPFRGIVKTTGCESLYQRIIELHKANRYDVVYFQFFHGMPVPRQAVVSPRACIEALRDIVPSVVVVLSGGDPFSVGLRRPHYPFEFVECARLADIVFSTQMGRAADRMVTWGAKHVVLSPLAMCPVRFQACHRKNGSPAPEFDVVFIGSRNRGRFFNPLSTFSYSARKREKLVKALSKRFGTRFGLFGKGWDGVLPNQGPIPFREQQRVFQRGRITVGAYPYSFEDYYASDRPFFSIASGVPTIEILTPRLDTILRDHEHCYFATASENVIEICERVLALNDKEVNERAASAAEYIASKHTQYHRAKNELMAAEMYQKKQTVHSPDYLLLDGVQAERERAYLMRHKQG